MPHSIFDFTSASKQQPVQSRGSFDKLGFNGAPASNEPSTLNENSGKPLSLECASRRHSRKVKTELCIYGLEEGGGGGGGVEKKRKKEREKIPSRKPPPSFPFVPSTLSFPLAAITRALVVLRFSTPFVRKQPLTSSTLLPPSFHRAKFQADRSKHNVSLVLDHPPIIHARSGLEARK